jgi:NADPH-dependent ferric siderophore reductase
MLKGMEIEAGTFVWIAAEANVVRAVRNYLLAERHQPRGWIKAGGYWLKGRADAHEKFD